MQTERRYRSLLVNPFFLNGLIWLVVLMVYQLGWSRLCPSLSDGMLFFLISTSVLSILSGVWYFQYHTISFLPLKDFSVKALTRCLIVLWILFIIEIAAAGGSPLLAYLGVGPKVLYDEFGLAGVHVIVVNGLSCVAIYTFYAYRSTQDKVVRKRLLYILCATLLPFILMFNRGGTMTILLGMFLILLLSTSSPVKIIWRAVFVGISILFIFGVMGNMRWKAHGSSGNHLEKIILQVGKASPEFQKSSIPKEFFWGYLYIATPLGNVQNTINRVKERESDTQDLQDMMLYEFTPEIITKRIKGEDSKETKKHQAILITQSLNATSVYGRVYKFLGWGGMWAMFAFTMLFILINLNIVPKNSKWFLPVLITIDEIIIMNLFDNMFIFMGMIPQLFIFLLIYFFQRNKIRVN